MPLLRKTALLPGVRNGDSPRELLFFQSRLARDVARQRPGSPRALMLHGNLLTVAHDYDAALATDSRLVAADPTSETAWYNLACSLALTRQPDAALDILEKALDLGFADARLLAADPDLASLRDLPRFRRLLARLEP